MTKIYINLDDKDTSKYLSDAINILDKASHKPLNMPSGYNNRSNVNMVKQEIVKAKNDLENIQSWLQNGQKSYMELLNNLEKSVGNIPKVDLKKAESIVR